MIQHASPDDTFEANCESHSGASFLPPFPGLCNSEIKHIFRLDIVHIKRSIGIRSKIYKPVSEVLQPIMARYLPDTPMQEVHLHLIILYS